MQSNECNSKSMQVQIYLHLFMLRGLYANKFAPTKYTGKNKAA